jgi:cell division protein FtsI (penicillin-binding protein 3)
MKIKKNKKNQNLKNQKSFYFEDYIQTNLKQKKISKSQVSEDRIYLLFITFFSLILIFTISIFLVSLKNPQGITNKKNTENFLTLRRDIVDRNGELISRNIRSYHAGVKPSLISNKETFIINIKLNFPEISLEQLKKNISEKNFFYLKRRLTEDEKNRIRSLGEKAIRIEPTQIRIYPQKELYSHILGQIDDDNYGISGVEKYFDKELKNLSLINEPLKLSLDTNIQYFIKKELEKSVEDFQAKGAAGLLMNINTGEVVSLVSLPDYNINKRKNINNKEYMNKITKGVFELGSVFKTFTIALALEENILTPETIITNIPNKIKCSKYPISDIKVFPKNLSAEDILIRSSNIGTLMIAREIGETKYKKFINKLSLLKPLDFELGEIGRPLSFRWDKCKLETVSYGHGITTTPLQAAAAYASISNGGSIVKPTLIYNIEKIKSEKIISKETSKTINKILRKVVTEKEGTASLADIFGYDVAGKTGTAKKYGGGDKNLNTFISIFPSKNPKHVLLVMLDEPKGAPHILYNYRGTLIKNLSRNEAGWNSVYVAGKIIEKIGPILAINNNEVSSTHVVTKHN